MTELTERQLLEALARDARGFGNVFELAERLTADRRDVRAQLRRLCRSGFVDRGFLGWYRLNTVGAALLARYRERDR